MNPLKGGGTEKRTKRSSHGTLPVMNEAVKQKERRVDALALGAEEGRDKLRKAAGSGTYTLIRRSPNGETHMDRLHVP